MKEQPYFGLTREQWASAAFETKRPPTLKDSISVRFGWDGQERGKNYDWADKLLEIGLSPEFQEALKTMARL